jgi:phytoene/squalene synthetase
MADALLGDLLRQVSRSFYLSLAILPGPLREPVGLAYLLARAADTVADTRLIPRAARIVHLETVRRGCAGEPADLGAVARACAPLQAHEAERRLVDRMDGALARVAALPAGDRAAVRAVLATITDGMLFDLGVSSPMLDDKDRGFSYMLDAPLDMRMDMDSSLNASKIVNAWPEQELQRILYDYG